MSNVCNYMLVFFLIFFIIKNAKRGNEIVIQKHITNSTLKNYDDYMLVIR